MAYSNAGNEVMGRIFDIKRFALHDGPGTRVTVHLKGCSLSCLWCHNPEGISHEPQLLVRQDFCISCGLCLEACSYNAIHKREGKIVTDRQRCVACGACATICPAKAREIIGINMSAADAAIAILKDESFFHSDDWTSPGNPSKKGGVTLSGGEPLEQIEFCLTLLDILGRKGIHRAIDTSGHVPEEIICRAADHCELFLYDLKHIDTAKHRDYTGMGNELILSNLSKLSQRGSLIQIRVPFIPGLNSEDDNISAIAGLAASLNGITGVNILPYHKAAANKHKRWGISSKLGDIAEPSEAELQRAIELFAQKGIAAQIGG